MTSENVLRVELDEKSNESSHVLVHVVSSGSLARDLELEATEGTMPFYAKISKAQIPKLLAKNAPIDASQWPSLLHATLLPSTADPPASPSSGGPIELRASLSTATLTLTLRQRTGDIATRLGSLDLRRDDDRELDTLAWAAAAADRARTLARTLHDARDEARAQARTIEELRRRVDDVHAARVEHEDRFLAGCAALVNAKKGKVRDQQRLLAVSRVDRAAAEQLDAARAHAGRSGRSARAGSERNPRKRSASGSAAPSPGASEASGDDAAAATPDNSEDGRETERGGSEIETLEGDNAGGTDRNETAKTQPERRDEPRDESAARPATQRRQGLRDQGNDAGSSKRGGGKAPERRRAADEDMGPPPTRELPFAKQGARSEEGGTSKAAPSAQAQPPEPAKDMEDEETDDDEL